jgi:hypothetical protein
MLLALAQWLQGIDPEQFGFLRVVQSLLAKGTHAA